MCYHMSMQKSKYKIGQRFKKEGGDYTFEGEIIAVFKKRSGAIRYAGEDDRGLIFIFNESSIIPI